MLPNDTQASPDAEVLARITPNLPRRMISTLMLALLGVIVTFIALTRPAEIFAFRLFLLGFGLGALWLGWTTWKATETSIELTEHVVRESGPNGRVLCKVEDVRRVDRGAFAFKPAGGFLLHLAEPKGGRMVAPGLWWRFGRFVAVGGVPSRAEAKNLADILTVMLVNRDEGK